MSFKLRKIRYNPFTSKREIIYDRFKKYFIYIVSAIGITGLGLLIYFSIGIPNPLKLSEMNLTESTEIMDRNGGLLYAIHGDENRKSLDSLDEISPWLIEATIAIEDDEFYEHIGIDVPAIFKAVLSEAGIGSRRGGSTITQQFARNALLSQERSYKRKVQEILLSLMIELRFSKDEILLMYLNAIPYGSNAYGVALAAEKYFDKDPIDLSLAESAILASIPNAPTRYSPYGNYKYSSLNFELTEETLNGRKIDEESDLSEEEYVRGLIGKTFTLPDSSTFYIKGRSDLVLERMEELGMIDENDVEEALAEIQILEFKPYKETIKAPHFVLWVKSLLEEKFGKDIVEQGGLKVYTTLDPDYQTSAETALANRKESNAANYNATNGALVSIHPQTGQILAMVGSADYFDDTIDGQVNMVTSARQPGSSFKPFIYSLAFLNQYSPSTILYDVETKFGPDTPKNYSGTFSGPVSIRYALGHSLNIPAIKAYFLAGQEESIIPFAKTFGFESVKEEGGYGYPLALGTAEVTPLELAGGFSVLANAGTRVEISPILKIENADGEVLEQWDESKIEKQEVLDPQVAFLINDVLSDSSVGLGPNIKIDSIDNAAKTGTSNKKLSNGSILPNNCWIAAYTPNLVTVVWTGNANGDPMNLSADGYTTSAPIWKEFMNGILDKLEETSWPKPEGIKELAISKASGKLPGPETPSDMIATEVFASFAIPTEIDDAYQRLKVETISNKLATEYSPEEFVIEKLFRVHKSILAETWPTWQAGIDKWLEEELPDEEKAPDESADDIHNAATAANKPGITITSPLSLSEVSGKTKEIEVDISSFGNGLDEVVFLLNDQIQYHETSYPYTGTIRLPSNAKLGTIIEVTAKIYDIYGYSDSSSIQLKIVSEEKKEEEDSEETTPSDF